MAALVHDHPFSDRSSLPEPVARFFGLPTGAVAAVDPAGVAIPPSRPALRVIPGGKEAALRVRQAPAVYRRRRLAVLVVAGLLLAAAVIGAVAATALTATPAAPAATGSSSADPAGRVGPAGSAGAAAPDAATAGDVYVVQPGDTLWGIAASLGTDGDIRALVDDLAALAGPGPLEAGTRLDLAALDR
jgi:hypothetical protein